MAPERTGWIRPEFEIVRDDVNRLRGAAGMPAATAAAESSPRRQLLLSLEEEFCSAVKLIGGFAAETLVTIALLKLFDVIRLVADAGPHDMLRSRLLEVAHDVVLMLWVFASVCRALRLFVPNVWRALNAPVARLANLAAAWKIIGREPNA